MKKPKKSARRKATAKKTTFVVHPPESYERFVKAEARRYARASAAFDVARLRLETVRTDLDGLKTVLADAEKKGADSGPYFVTSCSAARFYPGSEWIGTRRL